SAFRFQRDLRVDHPVCCSTRKKTNEKPFPDHRCGMSCLEVNLADRAQCGRGIRARPIFSRERLEFLRQSPLRLGRIHKLAAMSVSLCPSQHGDMRDVRAWRESSWRTAARLQHE